MSARSRALVGLAAVLTVVYLLAPSSGAAEAIRVLAPAIAVAAIVVGIAGFRPKRRLPWALIASSMGLLAGANVVWAVLFFRGDDTFPSASDAIHLVSAVALVVGLSILSRDSGVDNDGLGGIEVAIVGIAVGLGIWLAVVEPYLSDGDLALGDRIWAMLVPMLGAVAVAMAARMAIQSQFRSAAPTLMMIGVALLVSADVLRAVEELRDNYGAGGFVAALIIPAIAVDRRRRTRSHDDADEPGRRGRTGLRHRTRRLAERCRADAADGVAQPAGHRPRNGNDEDACRDLFGRRRRYSHSPGCGASSPRCRD